jgi:uncharacterized protein (DUF1697 family)
MLTFIALLRAVNVAGKNLLNMQALQTALAENGFINPDTYIQSGNVLFQHSESSIEIIKIQLNNCLKNDFNLEVEVQLFSAKEFIRIVETNPFLPEVKIEDLYLTFLFKKPNAEAVHSFPISGNDRWEIQDQVVYLHCPDGYGKTKLSNNLIESKFKSAATTRNGRTCLKLVEMAGKMDNE